MDKPRLLIVGNEEAARTQLRWALSGEYETAVAEDRESALKLLLTSRPHVVTLDLGLPPQTGSSGNGLRLLEEILEVDPLTRVVVITGNDDRSGAVKAVDMGAFEYYLKPVDISELRVTLRRACHLRKIDGGPVESGSVSAQPLEESRFPEILGSSQQMLSVFSTIDRAARNDVTVLVIGESGTGKKLVAGAIHAKSVRAGAPFVAINCGAIPDALTESKLFGYEKGAFTGSHTQRRGRLEVGNGGTVFLDEIGELSLPLQANLLRLLQKREVERTGRREGIPLDVRIIAGSNTDLRNGISNGSFRKDLYYRLAVVVVTIPPLRERGEDSVLLAKYFLDRISQEIGEQPRQFDQAAEDAIRSYAWPGNVRELQNKVKRAIIMARGRIITPSDLDLPPECGEPQVVSLREARQEAERQTIVAALRRNRGNISRAASEIGVSRPTLHALVTKFNLQPAKFQQR